MSRASSSSSSLDALIEWLYDAAVDARAWDGMAPALAATFGADSAVFKLHGHGGVHLLELTDNLHTAPRDKAWADHWHRNDLWVERTLALKTSGIVTSQQLLPGAAFERSGYYQDWNRRLGVYHMIGSVFDVAVGLSGVVGIHRPRRAAAFGAADRHRMARLLPHLQRAMRIRSHLESSRLAADAQAAAFDRLRTPALVLDADGRLLHANAQGEDLLRERSSLALSDGRVVAADPNLGFRWRWLVQQAALALGGSLLFERAGRPPLTALLAPLRSGASPSKATVKRSARSRPYSIWQRRACRAVDILSRKPQKGWSRCAGFRFHPVPPCWPGCSAQPSARRSPHPTTSSSSACAWA